MKRLLAIALIVAGCGNVGPTTAPASTTQSSMAVSASSTPLPPPSSTPKPPPTPKPTVKPKATLRPAEITFGKLRYTASGCWSSDYQDAEGHGISGTVVNFKVTAKNTGQVKSELLPIKIETADLYNTDPLLYKQTSWKVSTSRNTSTSISIEGPAVLPGKSRTLSWAVLFQSPFDVHYTVDLAGNQWKLWTSSQVC